LESAPRSLHHDTQHETPSASLELWLPIVLYHFGQSSCHLEIGVRDQFRQETIGLNMNQTQFLKLAYEYVVLRTMTMGPILLCSLGVS
jgi:hypothetical protein